MLVFYIVLQGIGGPNVRKRMGKIKDLPNHVSVLLLVEKWDKKWRQGRKKETERKKNFGSYLGSTMRTAFECFP